MKDRNRRGGKQDTRIFIIYHKTSGVPLRDNEWLVRHFKGYIEAKDHRKTLAYPKDWKIVQVEP